MEGPWNWADDDETRRLIEQGMQKLRHGRTDMQNARGFGHTERWDADLKTGVLTFTDRPPKVEAISR